MNKIKDLPKNERPREKLLDIGVQNLSDCELLAVIIGIKVLDHIIFNQKGFCGMLDEGLLNPK